MISKNWKDFEEIVKNLKSLEPKESWRSLRVYYKVISEGKNEIKKTLLEKERGSWLCCGKGFSNIVDYD